MENSRSLSPSGCDFVTCLSLGFGCSLMVGLQYFHVPDPISVDIDANMPNKEQFGFRAVFTVILLALNKF